MPRCGCRRECIRWGLNDLLCIAGERGDGKSGVSEDKIDIALRWLSFVCG